MPDREPRILGPVPVIEDADALLARLEARVRSGRPLVERADASALHELALHAAHGHGAYEVAIGEGLDLLARRGALVRLGYASVGDLAREKLGLPAGYARRLRRNAERLRSWPRLRAAVVAGEVSMRKAEVVLERAPREEDAYWTDRARGESIQALQRALKERRPGDGSDDEGRWHRVAVQLPPVYAEIVRTALEYAGVLLGPAAPYLARVEAMLQEFLGEFGQAEHRARTTEEVRKLRLDWEPPPSARALAASVMPAADVGRASVGSATPVVRPSTPPGHPERRLRGAPLRGPESRDARDERTVSPLERPAFLGDAADVERGGAALVVLPPSPPATAGGEGRGEGGQEPPQVADAVPFDPAAVLAHLQHLVRERAALDARLRRAALLMLETRAYVLLDFRRFAAWCEDGLHVSQRTLRAHLELERALRRLLPLREALDSGVLTAEQARQVGRHATPADVADRIARAAARPVLDVEREADEEDERQMWDASELRVTLPERVADLLREALDAARSHFPGRSAGERVVLIAAHAIFTWRHEADRLLKGVDRIRIRDRLRCQVPGCSGQAEHVHHIRFRSMGGSNDAWNLVCLCEAHHLAGVHAGNLLVEGRAPDGLVFVLGEVEVRRARRWPRLVMAA